ncbi:MAG: hypothetical protein AB7I27_15010 [Bacteriovoracaceae bacterium]
MSFGLLKHFKDLKKEVSNNLIVLHVPHVILGHDLGAVLKLIELKKQFPDEKIKLISNRLLNKQSLIEAYEFGVTTLRSSEAVEGIYKKFFNAKIIPQNKDALFYKDGKFHEFGGRAKSMDLLSGEDFFTHKGYRLSLQSLFSESDWENLDQIIGEALDIRIFESIEKTTPQDLVDKAEWVLHFKDFSKLTCTHLYSSLSPKKFLSYLTHKENFTPELIDVCTSCKIQAALSITLVLNKEIYQEERTLFIPQSMTHEWGHFIVEFESFNYQKKEQLCHVLFLIHEEEPQSEELAAKIKLMKRVLDRVFPHFEDSIAKEYIRFDEEMFISNIKDEGFDQMSFDYPSLKFTGQFSQVREDLHNQKFLARTLLS